MTFCNRLKRCFQSIKQKIKGRINRNTYTQLSSQGSQVSSSSTNDSEKSFDDFPYQPLSSPSRLAPNSAVKLAPPPSNTLAPPPRTLAPTSLPTYTFNAFKGSVCVDNNTNVTDRNEYADSTLATPMLSSSPLTNSPLPSPPTEASSSSIPVSDKLKNHSINNQRKLNGTTSKIDFHQTVKSRRARKNDEYLAVNPILEPVTVPNESARAVKFNSIVAYREYSYTEVNIKSSNEIVRFFNKIFRKWIKHDTKKHRISYIPLAKSKEFSDKNGKNHLMHWWEEVLSDGG